jgi:hypothetical protein
MPLPPISWAFLEKPATQKCTWEAIGKHGNNAFSQLPEADNEHTSEFA